MFNAIDCVEQVVMMKTYLSVVRDHALFFLWEPFSGESYTKAWEVNILSGVMCDFPCTPRHNCIKLWGQDHLHMGHFQTHCCANFAYETWSILDLGNLPRMNVLATRHDSGMIMFKLKRERLAFVMQGGVLYYIKEQHLHPYDFSTQKDNLLILIHSQSTLLQQ